ncbi:MAG: hypothetical protein MJA83_08590, partial [Gammaproteobacteria bacterium]|nr:hypothetical protein [Gammaproteobacteria bacterium]
MDQSENASSSPPEDSEKPRPRTGPNIPIGLIVVLLVASSLLLLARNYSVGVSEIKNFRFFHDQVVSGNVATIEISGSTIYGTFVEPPLAPEDIFKELTSDGEAGESESSRESTGGATNESQD